MRKSWKTALAAGASVVMPLEKQFWGDTYGILVDPFAQRWSMSGTQEHGKPDVESSDYKAGAEKLYPTRKKNAKRTPRKARASKR